MPGLTTQRSHSPQPPSVDELVRLAEGSDRWRFARRADEALRTEPEDVDRQALAALAYLKLGLVSPAEPLIQRIESAGVEQGVVDQLRQMRAPLPSDRITEKQRARTCRANVEVLAERGVDLRAAYERWASSLPEEEWFRTNDGNIVRRRTDQGSSPPPTWRRFTNERAPADRTRLTEPQGDTGADSTPAGVIIEGLDPPWLFQRVVADAPPTTTGFAPRVVAAQADPMELLDGLAAADLREVLSQPRVRLFVGADAAERLDVDLRRRIDWSMRISLLRSTSLRTAVEPPLETTLHRASRRQGKLRGSLAARARRRYAMRDRDWWAKRMREAASEAEASDETNAQPLRAMIVTTRFSTFMKHSAEDLAEALRRRGAHVELLMEPDDHSRFSPVALLRSALRLDPDLVVTINYMRGQTQAGRDLNPPWICWNQDSMAHLYDRDAADKQGEFDFLLGWTPEPLFDQFGYDRDRAIHFPAAVSANKFHPAPIASSTRRRFECELAYVGHQSETPTELHERSLREAGGDCGLRRALERARELVVEAVERPLDPWLRRSLVEAGRIALRESLGREPDAAGVWRLTNMYALPLADRLLRHRTLEWAAEIVERRGWRMRIFGRGWDRHPTLARYSEGPIEHGEDLRAVYQTAAAHLHVSVHTLTHQRVFECALSGGLPLCLLTAPAVRAATRRACCEIRDRAPDAQDPDRPARPAWTVADHPELMRLTALRQRLGVDAGRAIFTPPRVWINDDHEPPPRQFDADRLLVDPAEIGFTDACALEDRLDRAVNKPRWRAGMSSALARRARLTVTHDAMIERAVEAVRATLESPASDPHVNRGTSERSPCS